MGAETTDQVSGPPGGDEPPATTSSVSSSQPNTEGEGAPGKHSQGTPPPIKPAGISFGVELEFIVAWVYEDETDPDQDIADKLPPLLRVPRLPGASGPYDQNSHNRQQLAKALADAGLPVDGAKGYAPGSIQQRQADAGGTSAFSFTNDFSIREYQPESGYSFTGVELVSPAMWDTDNSFDLIQLAVTTITSSFRCRVNSTCGFHVHLGVGLNRRIDPRTLRKLGAFIWAAGPLLSVLHPPHRTHRMFSRGIREYNITRLGSADPQQETAQCWAELTDNDQVMARVSGRDRWLGEPYHIADDHMLKRIRQSVREGMAAAQGGTPSQHEIARLVIEAETGGDSSFREPGEPARQSHNRRFMTPVSGGSNSASSSPSSQGTQEKDEPWRRYGPPKVDIETPAGVAAKPKRYEMEPLAPPRPRKPVFVRMIPSVPLRPWREEDDSEKADSNGGSSDMTDSSQGDGSGEESSYQDSEFRDGLLDLPKRRDVMSGVATVLGADFSAGLVGALVCNHQSNKMAAYNLGPYRLFHYALGGEMDPELRAGKDLMNDLMRETTVEVREAAGTLRAGWVRTWARMWCGILRWCRDASEVDFLAVMRLLAWAQEEGGQYDVVDLLVDLGMSEQARACEERLRNGENERMEQEDLADPPLKDEESMGSGNASRFSID